MNDVILGSKRRGRQLAVPAMSYPSVSGFESAVGAVGYVLCCNGGYGGVQHALKYGIPLIVAGETSDKAEVAARVEYTGVGVNLGTTTPSPARIRTAVDDVLATFHYRVAAQRIGADITDSRALDRIGQLVSSAMRTRGVHN